jgi:Cu+-exporting ATPase
MSYAYESVPKPRAVVCTTDAADCDAMDVRLSRSWLRIAIAAVFAGQGMVFSLAINMTPPAFGSTTYWVVHAGLMLSSVIVMGFLGGPLFRSTFGMLRARRLSIEGLFTLSLIGAFVGSLVSTLTGEGGVFYEVVSIVIAIYTIGRMLSERSQAKLALESERLRERFDTALVIHQDGSATAMPLAEVRVGTRVRVDPGAAFTVDGVIVAGVGYIRETALTGEPVPVVRHVGDRVRAGTWSEDGVFEVEARAVQGERELDVILRTVEDASGRPSDLQTQANGLIQGFLPLVVGVSLATAIFWAFTGTWIEAVFNSMAVLLVACPCALGLATPVAIWQGLFQLSRLGLVSRDGALIDALAQTKQVFFDKTGTLSESAMRVTELLVVDVWQSRRSDLLAAVREVESALSHPIARALVQSIERGGAVCRIETLRTIPGEGVEALVELSNGACLEIRIGEPSLGQASVQSGLAQLCEAGGKQVFVFVAGALAAIVVLRERMRAGVPDLWADLAALGIEAAVLTGDPNPELELPPQVAIFAGLSAGEKEARVRLARDAATHPLFVGDGINDASAMACAMASISMGSGAGLTRSAASAQLIGDRIEVLPQAVRLARGIHQRLRGNLIYAAAYNVVGMGLAASGMLHPVGAAILMLVSSFWVTARALRTESSYNEN